MVCLSRPPPLMSPSPSLTFKVSFVVYVVSTKAAITTQVPLAVWQFLPKVSLTFSFFQSPTEQAPMQFQNFSNGHRFQTNCASHQSSTQIRNIVIFRFVPKLHKSSGKTVITASHTHTQVPTRFVSHVLSTYPLHHVPLVARSSPV